MFVYKYLYLLCLIRLVQGVVNTDVYYSREAYGNEAAIKFLLMKSTYTHDIKMYTDK